MRRDDTSACLQSMPDVNVLWLMRRTTRTGGNVSRSVKPSRLAADEAGTFCTVMGGFCVPSWSPGSTACCDVGCMSAVGSWSFTGCWPPNCEDRCNISSATHGERRVDQRNSSMATQTPVQHCIWRALAAECSSIDPPAVLVRARGTAAAPPLPWRAAPLAA